MSQDYLVELDQTLAFAHVKHEDRIEIWDLFDEFGVHNENGPEAIASLSALLNSDFSNPQNTIINSVPGRPSISQYCQNELKKENYSKANGGSVDELPIPYWPDMHNTDPHRMYFDANRTLDGMGWGFDMMDPEPCINPWTCYLNSSIDPYFHNTHNDTQAGYISNRIEPQNLCLQPELSINGSDSEDSENSSDDDKGYDIVGIVGKDIRNNKSEKRFSHQSDDQLDSNHLQKENTTKDTKTSNDCNLEIDDCHMDNQGFGDCHVNISIDGIENQSKLFTGCEQNEARGLDDLYTPRWIRGIGKQKEGLCPVCFTESGKQVWRRMKCSAYWYHMNYYHGISSITGKPFPKPTNIKAINEVGKRSRRQGMCPSCNKWIYIDSSRNVNVNVPEIYWWKHIQGCIKYE